MCIANRFYGVVLGVAALVAGVGFGERTLAADTMPKFQLARASLELDGKKVSPDAVNDPWIWRYEVGLRRFVIHEDTVEEIGGQPGKTAWSAKSADGLHLVWRGASARQAYFQAFKSAAIEGEERKAESPLQLRRLDLTTHKWTSSLELPTAKHGEKQHDQIVATSANDKSLAVLSETWIEGDNTFDPPKSQWYRVSLFVEGQDKPAWSHEFAGAGSRPLPGVGLWAAAMPDYAGSDIQHLQWLGDDVLVCAGEKDDLLCIDPEGKTKWRIERIWEYQRGFIGPSVWSHYIGRFGTDEMVPGPPDDEKDAKKRTAEEQKAADAFREAVAKERKEFDRQFQCAIVGGPVIVPADKAKGRDEASLFVAVAKGPNAWNWGYLSDCIAFEVSRSGRVEKMANLPRMVIGSQVRSVPGGVIWACQQNATVKLAHDPLPMMRGSPGGPDLILRLPWYRQYEADDSGVWFRSGKAGDATAIGDRYAFHAIGGGFIMRKTDKIYSFPILVIDTKNGLERTAVLKVPFEGDFVLPNTNVSSSGDETTASGPYLLGVTMLRIDGNQLGVVLGKEGSAVGLTFDRKSLEAEARPARAD